MIPKYRAWSTFKNEWVKHFYITESGLIYNMEQPHRDLIGAVPVEKSGLILMQSTGLFDKNGVEIFEGDVVRHIDFYLNSETVNKVYFKDGSFMYDVVVDEYVYDVPIGKIIENSMVEVIGNIYENQDLIESVET
ncbi:YopX family protein [Streptococcus dysgalactiae subsp. dysgalactiae]|uniref:YopX family protein n=1 Tax=Streptococcus dysgalactiae TaxID=1334 RepID=UPI001CF5A83A|nr:YopX family protein [Streptococcus dysgalactiae]MCB2832747.1 YopX family protein [Streptococcus dysgalactiae subsp. dysgalactiae]